MKQSWSTVIFTNKSNTACYIFTEVKKNTFDAKTRCAVSIVSNLIPVAVVQFFNLCRKLSGRKQHLRERNIVLHSIAENYTDDRDFLCHDYGQEMIVSPETKIVGLTENSIKKNRHIIWDFSIPKKKKIKNTGIIKDFCIGFIGFYCK